MSAAVRPTIDTAGSAEELRSITIRGSRVHNLQNVDVRIPRNRLTVVTGLSGSGKSSLAFDTVFAEGQRRYVESFSSYARMFLGQVDRPDVDRIDGLSPALAIDQKSTNRNPRSTVGTVTEIHDHLRLLWARAGVAHCATCGRLIGRQTVQDIADSLSAEPAGERFMILAPVVTRQKGTHAGLLDRLRADGFARVIVDGTLHPVDDVPALKKTIAHDIHVVVDRLAAGSGVLERITDSVETALRLTDGVVLAEFVDRSGEDRVRRFSERLACPEGHPVGLTEIEPRTFSFNAPFGACPGCDGIGSTMAVDENLLLGPAEASVNDGVLIPWSTQGRQVAHYYRKVLAALSADLGFTLDTPWQDLPDEARTALVHGKDYKVTVEFRNRFGRLVRYATGFEGVLPYIDRRYHEAETDAQRARWAPYLRQVDCASCCGQRLRPEVLAVTIDGRSIADVSALALTDASTFFSQLALTGARAEIAAPLVREITTRLQFLVRIGLGYLTLSRAAATLSGGEAQRIRLATQIGTGLTGVLYVLDEPSIGLHQRDNARLIDTMRHLRDLGNTVVVVEHDEDTIRTADWVIDVGPEAGVHGGRIIHSGTVDDLLSNSESTTADYLTGRRRIPVPAERRLIDPDRTLRVEGAAANNLRDIDVTIPLGVLTAVTGVSGSGKSSLVNDVLYRVLANRLNGAAKVPGRHTRVTGLEHLDKVIHVDQSPIGRTPRSNPATYTGLFDRIRTLFAQTPDAKVRGYQATRFSFNVKGGRCEACAGDGTTKIEMNFLPDVYVDCGTCHGARYNRETLEIRYKGKSIAEVLDMPIEEAVQFFAPIDTIRRYLTTLTDVGLGYIRLGQPATTLSGGEAQRVKLATELQRRTRGRSIYILDEPTTGLHFADVDKLLTLLSRLVDKGNTVVVIEHNLEVIKTADHIIDLGPEGGAGGGSIVASGTPEHVARVPESPTGTFLAELLAQQHGVAAAR